MHSAVFLHDQNTVTSKEQGGLSYVHRNGILQYKYCTVKDLPASKYSSVALRSLTILNNPKPSQFFQFLSINNYLFFIVTSGRTDTFGHKIKKLVEQKATVIINSLVSFPSVFQTIYHVIYRLFARSHHPISILSFKPQPSPWKTFQI
jgi:hypothetical protein